MMKTVVILDSAANDLEVARDFYDMCEMGVGDYFIECLMADIFSLRLYAGIHPTYEGLFKLNSKRFPFSIYYDISDELVRVAAVLDMRRDPKAIRRALAPKRVDQTD
jgi:hypothetical protein